MTAADLVDAMRLRQKAWGGDDAQYKPFLEARFAPARDAREYVAQAQHLQARAMDVAMRWLRAGAPRSMGALIWQWNDVWAGHSWSLVDAAGHAKPAWHAVRWACRPRMLSIEPIGGFAQWKGGALEVVFADHRAFVDPRAFAQTASTVLLERLDVSGEVRAVAEAELVPFAEAGLAAATLRARVPASILDGVDPTRELLVASLEGEPARARAAWFLGDDAVVALPTPALVPLGGGRFRAEGVIREFWIEGEDANPHQWRTLLPGDVVEMPDGARWWSANHFAKHRAEISP